jgi:hypothetical protein
MKKSNKVLFTLMIIGSLITWLTACSDSETTTSKVEVWLTDSPGDYQEVNIDVVGVEVHVGDDDTESGWISLPTTEGVYNLLELTNGIDTLLGEIEVPAGKISQIRLILGNNNSIKVGGENHPLSTPSAQQSGLKLQVHQTLNAGITYKILLDFDVARSIVLTGNGTYKLKPVIRTIAEAQDGAIKGIVLPKEATAAVYAIMNSDTLGTTFCDSTGHFLIRGLPSGMYKVSVDPSSDFQPTTKESVIVTLGIITDVGTIEVIEME